MPFFRPKFRAHVKAHKTVISNERWFRKGPPFLGKPFTVKKIVNRHATLIKILSRAGKRAARAGNNELADAYHRLRANNPLPAFAAHPLAPKPVAPLARIFSPRHKPRHARR